MPSVLTTTSVPTAFCAVPTGTPCAIASDGASDHAAQASAAARLPAAMRPTAPLSSRERRRGWACGRPARWPAPSCCRCRPPSGRSRPRGPRRGACLPGCPRSRSGADRRRSARGFSDSSGRRSPPPPGSVRRR